MAVGDQEDVLGRIKGLLPPWFGNDQTPILDAVLSGPSVILSFVYNLVQYGFLQVRLATATDGFLDIASSDYFGSALPRQAGEADAAYSARIRESFWPSKNTRPALIAAMRGLGLTVQVIEPWNPGDTGALNDGQTLAWNTVGCWGSRTMPFQCFAVVTRPSGSTATNAQIYAAIENVRPIAVKVWVRIFG